MVHVWHRPHESRAFEWFIAISICILDIHKLQNVESFSTMFLNYDLSIFQAVYIGQREPKFAGVGGSSNVPLGVVSLTENLMTLAGHLDAAPHQLARTSFRLRSCRYRSSANISWLLLIGRNFEKKGTHTSGVRL